MVEITVEQFEELSRRITELEDINYMLSKRLSEKDDEIMSKERMIAAYEKGIEAKRVGFDKNMEWERGYKDAMEKVNEAWDRYRHEAGVGEGDFLRLSGLKNPSSVEADLQKPRKASSMRREG